MNKDFTLNVLSLFDRENWASPSHKNKSNLALYHGSVGGCMADIGWTMDHGENEISIFDDFDYDFARDAAARYPELPLYIQPGNHTPPAADEEDADIDIGGIIDRYDWLVTKVSNDRWFRANVLPQLHVLIWGNKRGV